jgi:leucyl-tRNA synthetase
MGYGTSAIFACPAHDQRDLDFANKYDLPVIPVVLPSDADEKDFDVEAEAYTGPGTLINSDFLNGPRRSHHPISPSRLGSLSPTLLGLSHPRYLL